MNIASSPNVRYTILVTFTWDVNTRRYTKSEKDVTSNGNRFTTEPSIDFSFNKPLSTAPEPMEATLKIRNTIAPVDDLIKFNPLAPVEVLVEEINLDDPDTVSTLFKGKVTNISAKILSNAKVSKLTLSSLKRKLDSSIGLYATSTCLWTFGQSPCLYDLAGNAISGTISAVNVNNKPHRIQVDLLGSPDMSNQKWARGILKHQSAKVLIRTIVAPGTNPDPTVTMDLSEPVLSDWLTNQVTLFQGCTKDLETCRVHGQESQFMGPGIAIPSYNPLYRGQ